MNRWQDVIWEQGYFGTRAVVYGVCRSEFINKEFSQATIDARVAIPLSVQRSKRRRSENIMEKTS